MIPMVEEAIPNEATYVFEVIHSYDANASTDASWPQRIGSTTTYPRMIALTNM